MLLAEHLATLRDRLDEIAALAARTNKATVLVVQQFPVVEDGGVCFPPVRESIANLLAFVELGTAHDLDAILACAESFNWIAVDADHKLPESARIVQTAGARVPPGRLLFYSDNQVWFDSALDMVQRIEGGVSGRAVVMCGLGPLADSLALTLPRIGACVIVPDDETSPLHASIVLGASQKRESIDAALVQRLPANAAVYDVGIGNLTFEAAELARRLRNVEVVAGGLLAPAGAVIVDDIRCPTMIFGIADGHGRFKREPLGPDDRERVQYVRSLIGRALEAGPSR